MDKALILTLTVLISAQAYSKNYSTKEECIIDHGGVVTQLASDPDNNQIIDDCQEILTKQSEEKENTFKDGQLKVCLDDAEDEVSEKLVRCKNERILINKNAAQVQDECWSERESSSIKLKNACKEKYK